MKAQTGSGGGCREARVLPRKGLLRAAAGGCSGKRKRNMFGGAKSKIIKMAIPETIWALVFKKKKALPLSSAFEPRQMACTR